MNMEKQKGPGYIPEALMWVMQAKEKGVLQLACMLMGWPSQQMVDPFSLEENKFGEWDKSGVRP